MKLYVRMTDTFMSGWGRAEGKTNVLVIECDTWEQALAIRQAARDRREMRRIAICGSLPRSRPNVLLTHRPFSDFSGPWLAYYPANQSEAA